MARLGSTALCRFRRAPLTQEPGATCLVRQVPSHRRGSPASGDACNQPACSPCEQFERRRSLSRSNSFARFALGVPLGIAPLKAVSDDLTTQSASHRTARIAATLIASALSPVVTKPVIGQVRRALTVCHGVSLLAGGSSRAPSRVQDLWPGAKPIVNPALHKGKEFDVGPETARPALTTQLRPPSSNRTAIRSGCEVRHSAALALGLHLAILDELLHHGANRLRVRAQRCRDLLAALTRIVLHVAEEAVRID